MRTTRFIALAVMLVAVIAFGWLWYQPEPVLIDANGRSETARQKLSIRSEAGTKSPFAVQDTDSDSHVVFAEKQANPRSRVASQIGSPAAVTVFTQDGTDVSAQLPVEGLIVDVTAIGRSPLDDVEFELLVNQLQNDPQLLRQLVEEFRQETDPDRRVLLSRLLGEAGGAAVTLTASELIFSGNSQSRDLGLELLQRVQPGNSDAREIVSSLLATEMEPEVLVGSLTALASPGTVNDAARDNLSEQVALLSDHEDAAVRAISLNVLSRWTRNPRYTPVLLNGLNDAAPTVRESAAYALVGHEDASEDVINSLFRVIDNTQEQEAVRRGAILALKGMMLDDVQRSLVMDVERKLDTRPR